MQKPDAQAEDLVTDNEAQFKLNWDLVKKFASRHRMDLKQFLSSTTKSRYVVISVDPAGGGQQSEEAFVVWLVHSDKFALFSGRLVKGHKQGYSFSTIPLMFVVSLLETIRSTRQALRDKQHSIASLRTTPFVMPTVVVLIETNYAYGAAVYMQLLYFLDQQRRARLDLQDVNIVFATPVYMWDVTVSKKRDDVKREKEQLKRLQAEQKDAFQHLEKLWKDRPVQGSLVQGALVSSHARAI